MDLPEEEKAGIPAWVMTFADLMSLLMCFFVLLLSFSEMDAIKFKEIAAQMAKAFGVQRDIPATEIPMGTSPIFDKFSPGTPQPTPVDSVRQETRREEPRLKTHTADAAAEARVREAAEQQLEKTVQAVRSALQGELAAGMLQMEQARRRIVIRIEEKGSFPSGSAELSAEFERMIGRIGQSLARVPGEIAVEGHTDDVPISTARFRSNWDLSAARASSVANALLASRAVKAERLRVHGFAETRPLADNFSAASRASNRRVEIVVDLAGPVDAFEARARDLAGRGMEEMIQYMDWQTE